MEFLNANTILYCEAWNDTVAFYKTVLSLPVSFSTDWFVEFKLSGSFRLSIADARRSTIKAGRGAGITLSLEVCDLEQKKAVLDELGVHSTSIQIHPWNARVFYLKDPEGHRIEFWQKIHQ